MAKTIQCFKCDKELENWNYRNILVHPMKGLHFLTYGHYGSSFFDPMDGSTLNIAICDECVETNKHKIIPLGRNAIESLNSD